MTVHPFGAVSSPSCANYALRRTANDNEAQFGRAIANVLRNSFYVDDMLQSVPTPKIGSETIQGAIEMTSQGGFPLVKVISNSKEVIESVPNLSRAKSIKSLDLQQEPLPTERALGVQWCVENDCFGFQISRKPSHETRRGILSTVASIYHPLGLASPFILKGRILLQELCAEKKGWDENLTEEQIQRWRDWREELEQLAEISVPRCYKPSKFGEIVHAGVHHFSDASDREYGTASYFRLKNTQGQIHCCNRKIESSTIESCHYTQNGVNSGNVGDKIVQTFAKRARVRL